MKKVLFILLAVVFMIVPFFLDWLYGTGLPGRLYNNNFSSETWFSFLGSYVPAMLIGLLTLYQQYIIREQDQRYKKLRERYLYTLDRNAEVFRYSPQSDKIGKWECSELAPLLKMEQGISEFYKVWKKGYVLECYVHNISDVGIKDICCDSVEWIIASKQPYRVEDPGKIKVYWRSVGESRYIITVFWTFQDENGEIAEEVIQCMNNHSRKNPDYYTSYVFLKVRIINEANGVNNVYMKFKLQLCHHEVNSYKLQSIEEHFLPV